MPTTPDNDELLARLHEAYHKEIAGPVFRDVQPGTAEFTRVHLVGSSAPEPVIQRFGPIGAEGYGPVELIDGRTGRAITRVNRHLRRRLED